jgi:hypothetical protein
MSRGRPDWLWILCRFVRYFVGRGGGFAKTGQGQGQDKAQEQLYITIQIQAVIFLIGRKCFKL